MKLAAAVVMGGLALGACASPSGPTSAQEQDDPSADRPVASGTPSERPRLRTESTSPAPTRPADQPTPTVTAPPESQHRGTEAWRITRPGHAREIAAYSTRSSGVPGRAIELKVSTTEKKYVVSAYRIGAYDGGSGRLVWTSRPRTGREQAAPAFAPHGTRTVVAPWRRDLTIDTGGWVPGFYVLKLRTSTGWETLVPYVVSSESAEGTVALVAPVTTWQAYNEWGGYSLYHGPDWDRRSWAVSFDRPYNGATGANDYRTAALPVVVRAEELGIPLSYFTNVDLHVRPGVLDGARGYVSMGHDEYWTTEMRDAVTAARDAGTNLAFLGANTMYWRVRLARAVPGDRRVVVGYRSDAHLDPLADDRPREATARFRDAPAAQPEEELVGMRYECYPVDTDYVVTSPDWWGFRGTGVRSGTRFEQLVGPEADRVYPVPTTPRPLQVLSNVSYSCDGVTTTSQSVYYTVPSGAGVFTAGTLRWGCALVDRCDKVLGDRTRRFVRTVTGNLLRGFARGPVGLAHPAHDNLEDFDLPAANLVGAS